jgi:RNA polymerase sigma-70 factor (ECF subfamily)
MGEPSDFERLILERVDSLYGYALALTRRAQDAEDLLQDSLVRAFERFGLFDRSLSFNAWMFTIVRHTHIDRLRKLRARGLDERGMVGEARGEPVIAEESPLYAIPLDPEAILARQETLERLRDAIWRLPAEMREVVALRDIEGLSYREIAGIVSCPLGTVMSRLYRGRNLLRTYLVEAMPETKRAESSRGL